MPSADDTALPSADDTALDTAGHRTRPHGSDAEEPFPGVVW
ncbi:hypothetical protein [Streptomyces sp. NPDC020362]